jgi:hypothetical protein
MNFLLGIFNSVGTAAVQAFKFRELYVQCPTLNTIILLLFKKGKYVLKYQLVYVLAFSLIMRGSFPFLLGTYLLNGAECFMWLHVYKQNKINVKFVHSQMIQTKT